MRVVITGAGGFIGRKLVDRLVRDGEISGQRITHLTQADLAPPHAPAHAPFPIVSVGGNLSRNGEAERLLTHPHDLVIHLATLASGGSEEDFDGGMNANFHATRFLWEAIRQAGHHPRVVFTSSIAVFGAPFPDPIPDDFHLQPLTSYGVQKAIGELQLMDYTRKGFFDGIAIRLPTVVVRPGKPNSAASSFFSGIIREPLQGIEATCPVDKNQLHWFASPRAVIGFLLHAASIDGKKMGPRRALTMPGLGLSIGEVVEALDRVAGPEVVKLIRFERDERIARIVSGWPTRFTATRGQDLGFEPDPDFDTIIGAFMADELGMKV
ncbi:Nucleoside-diphosphate-sugar epimerases [hydrothermal vent metagenome]|uniref:Nucleoside-diphosphate-sugar epimerases n=1 Tax=hydrothermal vent metagenome TaxID=652676 RepID=A0A3B0SWB8_9ZZZZ